MKRMTILGSTGSIGVQALEVFEKLNIRPVCLTTNINIKLLEQQARRFKPDYVAAFDTASAKMLKLALADTDIAVLSGEEGICFCARQQADMVLVSIVGIAGLRPTIAAIDAKNRIALANKETLVCAGEIVISLAKQNGVDIIPVDSEHSAIFQCIANNPPKSVKSILLTASGGPFFGRTKTQLEQVTAAQALRHPNWDMGGKITIDSATLMNKGLEFIEAMHLFSLPPDRIKVVVHKQSIIHSAVEFIDNSVVAQMGVPDMRLPISYAITYPTRTHCLAPPLDLLAYGSLTFEKPDLDTFPCLKLAQNAALEGMGACTALNASNEIAVSLFLQGRVKFPEIAEIVENALSLAPQLTQPTIEQIFDLDLQVRSTILDNLVCQTK